MSERNNKKGKNMTVDTNIPINYAGHITNFVRDKENVAVIHPEILFEEFDNVKRKAKTPKHGVYEASSFFEELTSKFRIERDFPTEKLGFVIPSMNKDHKSKIIDFSDPFNKDVAKKLSKNNPLFADKLEGTLALVPLMNLIENKNWDRDSFKSELEKYVCSSLDFSIDLGINDNLLAGLTLLASQQTNKENKLITLDKNLRTKINLERPGLVEAPTGGLRLAGEKYQGYRIIGWDEGFVSRSYLKEFRTEIMRINDLSVDEGFELDLSKFDVDAIEKLHTQDYLVFTSSKNKKEIFKRQETEEDIPEYNMPQLNHIVRLVQTGRDEVSGKGKYKVLPLDQRLLKPNSLPKYLSNFKVKSLEGLLFLDSMLQDKHLYILHGEAGTGKTYSALYVALAETLSKYAKGIKDPLPKILINKPLVNLGGADYGYLPGDLYDKHGPFMASLEEAFNKIKSDIGQSIFNKLSLRQVIEGGLKSHPELIQLVSASGIRGLNIFRNYVKVTDEFQNYAPKVGLEFLPRLGSGKMLFSGDPFQTDATNIDMGYNAMREIMVRSRNALDYNGEEDKFKNDLDLQNKTTILHFQNTLRSKHTEAILYRYHGIGR